MTHSEILQQLLSDKMVAILRVDDSSLLVDLCQALAAGGVTSMEITMTVPHALRILEEVRQKLPAEVLLGAGTILDSETARLVTLAGADFIVSPHFDVDIIKTAKRYGKPSVAGAFTPTEIVQAWQSGADIVKLFPSDPLGAKYLKNIRGPLPQIRLMPTGGVNLETIEDFFKAGACAVGIGGSLLKKDLLAERNFQGIEDLARQYVEKTKACTK